MKWLHKHFRGLYWRQMAVTVGMVALTLVLLGVSFFSLSYSYARGQKTDELLVRAQAVSKLSVRYLETGRYLSMEELQKDEQFRQLAATAALISRWIFWSAMTMATCCSPRTIPWQGNPSPSHSPSWRKS